MAAQLRGDEPDVKWRQANDASAPSHANGPKLGYVRAMARKKRYLTATMPDGYVKTIGPTSSPFTHYWRIVADLGEGRTEVFWGHAKSLKEATGKRAAAEDASRQRRWEGFAFEVVELTESQG